ncbi:uncharacterized protein LOC132611106 [Lycium barbarum]|uniref:uncharacterized protein LOC132611106 n=1 Tax=Lycium barbarum TaxID=112863 RepID=UPI00293EC8DB|nr:uncharacterized protein LOC132611106 [Lycium barbarum]
MEANNNRSILYMKDSTHGSILAYEKYQSPLSFHITIIYAKCDEPLRRGLWDDLRDTAGRITGSLGVVGGFNVITKPDEKTGGRPCRIEESLDFLACLSDCNLQDGGFLGSRFTWSDYRDPPNTIWKRLDNLVYNAKWFDSFGAFEDIFEEPKRLEILIRNLEETSLTNNNHEIEENLAKARADFTKFIKFQDNILRQKAQVKWLHEGDANIVFFHSIIKDRRKRLCWN